MLLEANCYTSEVFILEFITHSVDGSELYVCSYDYIFKLLYRIHNFMQTYIIIHTYIYILYYMQCIHRKLTIKVIVCDLTGTYSSSIHWRLSLQ